MKNADAKVDLTSTELAKVETFEDLKDTFDSVKTETMEFLELSKTFDSLTKQDQNFVYQQLKSSINYYCKVGLNCTAIFEYHKENLKPKKLVERHLSDGTKIDITRVKEFCDYLQDQNLIPVGYAQMTKFAKLSLAKTHMEDLIKHVEDKKDLIRKLSLLDLNKLAKYASHVLKLVEAETAKTGQESIPMDSKIESYEDEIEKAVKSGKSAEQSNRTKYFASADQAKKALTLVWYPSQWDNLENCEVTLLNFLLAKYGLNEVKTEILATVLDQHSKTKNLKLNLDKPVEAKV